MHQCPFFHMAFVSFCCHLRPLTKTFSDWSTTVKVKFSGHYILQKWPSSIQRFCIAFGGSLTEKSLPQLSWWQSSKKFKLLFKAHPIFACLFNVRLALISGNLTPFLANLLHDFPCGPVWILTFQFVTLLLAVENIGAQRLFGLTMARHWPTSWFVMCHTFRRAHGLLWWRRSVTWAAYIVLTRLSYTFVTRFPKLGRFLLNRSGGTSLHIEHITGNGSTIVCQLSVKLCNIESLTLIVTCIELCLSFFLSQRVKHANEPFHFVLVALCVFLGVSSKLLEVSLSLDLPYLANLFHNIERRDVWHWLGYLRARLSHEEHIRRQRLFGHLVEKSIVLCFRKLCKLIRKSILVYMNKSF